MVSSSMAMKCSSPTPISVIETCWSSIEIYLDLEASVFLSQTCQSLRRAIIDPDTNKLKLTHFEAENSPPPTSDVPNNWKNAATRIPHYIAHSLNAIHFPSLRRLHINFPSTKRRNTTGHNADIIDDACSTSFPILVANLSSARNLEHLHLDASRLMATERSGQLESLYEIFAANLMNHCRKLKFVYIVNSGFMRGNDNRLYSIALTRALTAIIKKRKLEELRVIFAGTPSDPLHHRLLSSKGVDSMFDFFVAAFSSKSLNSLHVGLFRSHQHLNALLNAANHLSSDTTTPPPTGIKQLTLTYTDDVQQSTEVLEPQSNAASLLEFFSCSPLVKLYLNLPRRCWDDRAIHALRKMLQNKPTLRVVIKSKYPIDISGFHPRLQLIV